MVISSRTPEGLPNQCPVCHNQVRLEPSVWFGDAPCPHCGTLLWFGRLSHETRYYESSRAEPYQEQVIQRLAERFGFEVEELRGKILEDPSLSFLESTLGGDSLDLVELFMELEEGLEQGD